MVDITKPIIKLKEFNGFNEKAKEFLSEGELIESGYHHKNQGVVFTNKKIIIFFLASRKVQNLTFIPYKSVVTCSVQCSGDNEIAIDLLVDCLGTLKMSFNNGVNLKKIVQFIQ